MKSNTISQNQAIFHVSNYSVKIAFHANIIGCASKPVLWFLLSPLESPAAIFLPLGCTSQNMMMFFKISANMFIWIQWMNKAGIILLLANAGRYEDMLRQEQQNTFYPADSYSCPKFLCSLGGMAARSSICLYI